MSFYPHVTTRNECTSLPMRLVHLAHAGFVTGPAGTHSKQSALCRAIVQPAAEVAIKRGHPAASTAMVVDALTGIDKHATAVALCAHLNFAGWLHVMNRVNSQTSH